METATADHNPLIDLELALENDGGNLVENEFHFGFMAVDTPADTSLLGQLATGESSAQNNDFDEACNLVFHERIPSLQEMASNAVANAVWRRVISLKTSKRSAIWYPRFDFVHKQDENEALKLIQNLPVPRLIREQVENCVEPMRSEMNEWACYFWQSVFMAKQSAPEDPIEMLDLMFCHWLPNGTIDYRRTATNMLSNPRLTLIDRFKIMCKYCFENEIRRLPIESIPERFVKKITFHKNPLMFYWLCRTNGNIDKLPRKNNESVECFLITAFNVDSWSSIEYFWNCLNFSEQVSKALILLKRKPQFQKQLFAKMNDFQKSHVLATMPFEITMNFWRQKSHERFAYLIWLRIKDTISFDQFTKFIYALLTESLPNDVVKLKYLVKIWTCSSSDFINRALNSMRNIVIGLHSKYYHHSESYGNLKFLLVFLSYGSVEYRKTVLFEQGCNLVLYNDFSMIDQLIELCLPDPRDVVEFKNILLRSENVRRHCCSMLDGSGADIKLLTKFLNHYCPDLSSKIDFISRILNTWTIDGCNCYNLKKCNDVIDFIDEYVLDTFPDQAIKFKKRVVWSFVDYFVENWSKGDEMRKFIDVVYQVLDAEDLNKFKFSIVETVRTRYRWSNFDEENIRSLLSWCFNDDDLKIKEFKKTLVIDEMFESSWEVLHWNCRYESDVSWQTINEFFEPVDKMFLWYFENADEIKKYKLEKVFGRGDTAVWRFFEFGDSADERYKKSMRMTLPWFFEGDNEQIRKFKEKYKNEFISRLIDVD